MVITPLDALMATSSKTPARLIWATAETCADLRYATGFSAPDPFLWLDLGRERWLVVSTLEIGRARHGAHPGIRVLSREEAAVALGLDPATRPSTAALILAAARKFRRNRWEVPADFPLGLAHQLQAGGLVPHVVEPFFPGRRRKTSNELTQIRTGVRLATAGLARAREVLRNSQIGRNGILAWDGAVLTADRLRAEIDLAVMHRGGSCMRTIVAPGRQGADPHEAGHGPIRAHQPVVVDVFPRDGRSGYHGDLTRTWVKGRAPEIVRRAHAAVRAAQRAALAEMRPGTPVRQVHAAVSGVLREHGFDTDLTARPPRGFIHSTGHGLGLEVHESPRLADIDGTLETGDVVTVEPGLYDPQWGGVRLEDDVFVAPDGPEVLSRFPYALEIP
jgi:Xaa-Pro aminopeptidase